MNSSCVILTYVSFSNFFLIPLLAEQHFSDDLVLEAC